MELTKEDVVAAFSDPARAPLAAEVFLSVIKNMHASSPEALKQFEAAFGLAEPPTVTDREVAAFERASNEYRSSRRDLLEAIRAYNRSVSEAWDTFSEAVSDCSEKADNVYNVAHKVRMRLKAFLPTKPESWKQSKDGQAFQKLIDAWSFDAPWDPEDEYSEPDSIDNPESEALQAEDYFGDHGGIPRSLDDVSTDEE